MRNTFARDAISRYDAQRVYTPTLSDKRARRSLRRAYSRSRQSHPDYTLALLCAALLPLLLILLAVYLAA